MFMFIQLLCVLCAIIGAIGWFRNADKSKRDIRLLLPVGLCFLGDILPSLSPTTFYSIDIYGRGQLHSWTMILVVGLYVLGGIIGVKMYQQARSMKLRRFAEEEDNV